MSTANYQGTHATDDIRVYDDNRTGSPASSRIRGGSVLGGAVVGLGTLLLLELLLMTAGLSGATLNAPGESGGSFVWDAIAGAIALFLAGLVAGAAVTHRDAGTGVLNGITCWATIVVGMLLLSGAVGTSIFGALGNVLASQQTAISSAADNATITQQTADTFRDGAGWAAISFAVSLALCALGGMIGSKTKPTDEGQTTTARR